VPRGSSRECSASGAALIVPAFRQFTDLTFPSAAATSLAVIALVSSTTVVGILGQGGTISAAGWTFAASAGAGMLIGRKAASRLPVRWLQVAFAVLVLCVATAWLVKLQGSTPSPA